MLPTIKVTNEANPNMIVVVGDGKESTNEPNPSSITELADLTPIQRQPSQYDERVDLHREFELIHWNESDAQLPRRLQIAMHHGDALAPRLKITTMKDGSIIHSTGSAHFKVGQKRTQSNRNQLDRSSLPTNATSSTIPGNQTVEMEPIPVINPVTTFRTTLVRVAPIHLNPNDDLDDIDEDETCESEDPSVTPVSIEYQRLSPWRFPLADFQHYGLGLFLYFSYLRNCCILFLLLGLLSIPSLIINLSGPPTDDDLHQSTSSIGFEKTSLGNLGDYLLRNSTEGIYAQALELSVFGTLYSKDTLTVFLSFADLLSTILFLCFYLWQLRAQQKAAVLYSYFESLTIANFSIMMHGLPDSFGQTQPDADDERDSHVAIKRAKQALSEWIEARVLGSKVIDITFVSNDYQLLELQQRRDLLTADLRSTKAAKRKLEFKSQDVGTINPASTPASTNDIEDERGRLDAQIKSIQTDLLRLESSIRSEATRLHSRDPKTHLTHKRIVAAFVTFEDQASARRCVELFTQGWKDFFLSELGSITLKRRAVADSSQPPNASNLFQGAHLIIRKALEPSNLIGPNLSVSLSSRRIRRVITAVVTGILILISVGVVALANYYRSAHLKSATDNCPDSVTSAQVLASSDSHLRDCFCSQSIHGAFFQSTVDCSGFISTFLVSASMPFLSAGTIVLVNFLLKRILRALVKFEAHETVTSEQESTAFKVFVGLFLNTGVVLLVISNHTIGFGLSKGGVSLSSDTSTSNTVTLDSSLDKFNSGWYLEIGTSIILTMLINVLTPQIMSLMKIVWYSSKRRCCISKRATQSQINSYYVGTNFDLSTRYASILSTIFVTLLYSSSMPILLWFAAASFFTTYWFDKIAFFKTYATPPRFDATLAFLSSRLLPLAALLHLSLTLYFFNSPPLSSGIPLGSSNPNIIQRIFRVEVSPVVLTLILLLLLMVGLGLIDYYRSRSQQSPSVQPDDLLHFPGLCDVDDQSIIESTEAAKALRLHLANMKDRLHSTSLSNLALDDTKLERTISTLHELQSQNHRLTYSEAIRLGYQMDHYQLLPARELSIDTNGTDPSRLNGAVIAEKALDSPKLFVHARISPSADPNRPNLAHHSTTSHHQHHSSTSPNPILSHDHGHVRFYSSSSTIESVASGTDRPPPILLRRPPQINHHRIPSEMEDGTDDEDGTMDEELKHDTEGATILPSPSLHALVVAHEANQSMATLQPLANLNEPAPPTSPLNSFHGPPDPGALALSSLDASCR